MTAGAAKMVETRRSSGRPWHTAATGEKIAEARRTNGEQPVHCRCGEGPFRGSIGLATHVRHKHPDDRETFSITDDTVIYSGVDYRKIFKQNNGPGPWPCHFCGRSVVDLLVHHLDEDRTNGDPSNLVAAHMSCHVHHHRSES